MQTETKTLDRFLLSALARKQLTQNIVGIITAAFTILLKTSLMPSGANQWRILSWGGQIKLSYDSAYSNFVGI